MTTTVLGSSDALSAAIASGLGSFVGELDEPPPAETDGVVLLAGTKPAQPVPIDTLGEAEWHLRVGASMRQFLAALQRARIALQPDGGAIVSIVPSIGMAGAEDLVPYTTVIEGIRAMLKSAARHWASSGVRVNVVAVPLHLFDPGIAASASHLT
jgi:3-oxoacyl-[acyl-carrier protein] reductase